MSADLYNDNNDNNHQEATGAKDKELSKTKIVDKQNSSAILGFEPHEKSNTKFGLGESAKGQKETTHQM